MKRVYSSSWSTKMVKVIVCLLVNLAVVSAFRAHGGRNVAAHARPSQKDQTLTLARGPREDLLLDDIRKAPLSKNVQNSGISDSRFLWSHPVPYAFDPEMSLETKAVIVKSLHDFMLKTCITFKPREEEDEYYIYFQKTDGSQCRRLSCYQPLPCSYRTHLHNNTMLSRCWSYIGNNYVGKQPLSIGPGCDQAYIVKHEVLHALGFIHEQSRNDRDDYVSVNFDNVIEGQESNFEKVPKSVTITNGVPYDYLSVMHYSQYAFAKEFAPTIATQNPEFQNLIGMYTEMSPADVLELNLLYQCERPVANSIQCTFEPKFPCQMEVCEFNKIEWSLQEKLEGHQSSDHTSLPIGLSSNTKPSPVPGTFGHFSTSSCQEGDTGWVATPIVTPTLGCKRQCLQFYYYHSGADDDVMNIWIREFRDHKDHIGKRRLVGQVTGPPTGFWKLHHVSLDGRKHFRVEFEAHKGQGVSTGGISIDDINISETMCPTLTLHVNDFVNRDYLESELVYSSSGYRYIAGVKKEGPVFRLFVSLASGENDATLEWPVKNHRIAFTLLDQNPTYQDRMSFVNERAVNQELTVDEDLVWGNPRTNTKREIKRGEETIYVGQEYVTKTGYSLLERLQLTKGGSTAFFIELEDASPYRNTDSLPCPPLKRFEGGHGHHTDEDCFSKMEPVTKVPPPMHTDDKSVFGFCPAMVASPVLVLSAGLLLLMP